MDVTSVEEDVLKESPELACRIELDITANFEGDASKDEVLSQIRQQLLSSVKSGITSVARDLNLRSSGVTVRPLRMECDINDA